MYYYIYDSFLESPRYRKIIDRVELRLADLGITGDVARVRPLRDLKEIVWEGLVRGRRTIITLGNDYTFAKVANIVLNQDKIPLSELTLGFIPMDEPNSIGQGLGIPLGEIACDVISSRIVKVIDLGQIRREYFFTKAIIGFGADVKDKDKKGKFSSWRAFRYHPAEVILKLDNKFQVRVDLFGAIFTNLAAGRKAFPHVTPEDGVLNVFVVARMPKFSLGKRLKLISEEQYYSLPKTSLFKAKRVEVAAGGKKNFDILADNRKIGRTPTVIEVASRKLRVIVGKERTF